MVHKQKIIERVLLIVLAVLLTNIIHATKHKFRSRIGCCICGTKSQSGKPFLKSCNYKEKFPDVFGLEERQGDICNACIRVVQNWKDSDSKKIEVSCQQYFVFRDMSPQLSQFAMATTIGPRTINSTWWHNGTKHINCGRKNPGSTPCGTSTFPLPFCIQSF